MSDLMPATLGLALDDEARPGGHRPGHAGPRAAARVEGHLGRRGDGLKRPEPRRLIRSGKRRLERATQREGVGRVGRTVSGRTSGRQRDLRGEEAARASGRGLTTRSIRAFGERAGDGLLRVQSKLVKHLYRIVVEDQRRFEASGRLQRPGIGARRRVNGRQPDGRRPAHRRARAADACAQLLTRVLRPGVDFDERAVQRGVRAALSRQPARQVHPQLDEPGSMLGWEPRFQGADLRDRVDQTSRALGHAGVEVLFGLIRLVVFLGPAALTQHPRGPLLGINEGDRYRVGAEVLPVSQPHRRDVRLAPDEAAVEVPLEREHRPDLDLVDGPGLKGPRPIGAHCRIGRQAVKPLKRGLKTLVQHLRGEPPCRLIFCRHR